MLMRASVAALLLFFVGLAGCSHFQSERLSFSPRSGDVRYFHVSESMLFWATDGFPGTEVEYNLSSLVKAEVTAVDDGISELNSRSLSSLLLKNGHILFTTDKDPAFSESLTAMKDLLTSGVVERIDDHGQVVQARFGNQDAVAKLDGKVHETALVRRGLSIMAAWHPRMPQQSLKIGMAWQVPPLVEGGLELPELRYEVSHLDEDTVTLKFQSAGTDSGVVADDSGRGFQEVRAERVKGYLELERHSGWPRRASIVAHRKLGNDGDTAWVSSQMSLEQGGLKPSSNRNLVHSNAAFALYHDRTRTSDPWFESEYLPPFGERTVEESFDRLARTLLWFGTDVVDQQLGLSFQVSASGFSSVLFHLPEAVRLLDSGGKPVVDEVAVDPRFLMGSWYSVADGIDPPLVPFLTDGLSQAQLDSIDRVEVDLPVTVPDQLHTLRLSAGDSVKPVGDSGITIAVDEWAPEQVILRVTRPEGYLPDAFPLIKPLPLTGEGEPLPLFYTRESHSLFEPLRAKMAAEFTEQELMWKQSEFAGEALLLIEGLPMAERYGDLIYSVKAPAGESIEAIEVNLYTTRDEVRTFSAPKALSTLKGGKVVGERFLTYSDVRDVEFAPLNLSDVTGQDAAVDWPNVVMTTAVPAESGEVRQVDANTVEVSEALFSDLEWVRAAHGVNGLPLIAYAEDGSALKPLTEGVFGAMPDALKLDGRKLRFWGEVARVHYPVRVEDKLDQAP